MWISRGEYRRLLRQVVRAERRYENALASLSSEREANRVSERWWANALLRAKQAYPMPVESKSTAPAAEISAPAELGPAIDLGEYEALVAAAAEYGVDKTGVDQLLRRERGEEL
jgi:hypothetical protein